ncbi:hypothetical protein N431DRAFT_281916, partial [Stipitochalara longipes BDJ]
AEISIVNIPVDGDASQFSITPMRGARELSEHLPSLAENSSSSQLVIVENICPDTLALLGGSYDIDIQFFAEYASVVSWYQMYEMVPERLAALPSTRNAEDFLSLRYVSTRQLYEKDDASIRAVSVIWPDMEKTRIGTSAGRLKPISAPKRTFPPMAFTRQFFSVWCKKKINCQGWIAIMLLDRPFPLETKYGFLGIAEYRNPNLRPKANESFDGDDTRESFKQAFCSFLDRRCTADETYRKACATDPFLTLYEGYRIIASEWLVVNEYVKRELTNIERHLEKKDLKKSTFQELEQHLKELYRIRRRCNKDRELVIEAASQCEKRGQRLWPCSTKASDINSSASKFAEQHAQDLEEDFKYVLSNMSTTISRIEKDISLLMALVAISEGRQSLQENRGISFLTLVATIFLPCETVASVLGIQTQYAPGARYFWMLWAVALPLT